MDLVQNYIKTYKEWKQSHYSQKVYNDLIDIYEQLNSKQRAEVSERLIKWR